jgi:hypothetical protein
LRNGLDTLHSNASDSALSILLNAALNEFTRQSIAD